jgi:transposase-like protein
MKCPDCGKKDCRLYGHIRKRVKGTKQVVEVQRYRCNDCLHQFSK